MQAAEYRDLFIQSYCETLLWADTREITGEVDEHGEDTGEMGGHDHLWHAPYSMWALDAFDADSQIRIVADCNAFMDRNGDLIGLDPRQSGHDFLLTRNGHGAGFWDRGLGELGTRLTSLAKPYGSTSAEFGSDDSHVTLVEG